MANLRLNTKALEKLRTIINEESEYRSGPKLVQLFNQFGFSDSYGQGFPSRWVFTDLKLERINGTPRLNECIQAVLAPVNFVGNISLLDRLIDEFNKYLAFDGYIINRKDAKIVIAARGEIPVVSAEADTGNDENEFLSKEFSGIPVSKIDLDPSLVSILIARIDEIRKCLKCEASLSVIFLCGSVLEGVLLGIALKRPKEFNQSVSSPKNKEGIVRKFPEWSLSDLIEVAYDLSIIRNDVKKFSHSLRDFRNYIHPYQQMAESFAPNKHTSKIAWQVLNAAIHQIHDSKN